MSTKKRNSKKKPVVARKTSSAVTMEQLLARPTSKVNGYTRGQKVDAKLMRLEKKQADFDIGGKTEGVIRDIYFNETRSFLKTLKIGDEIELVVIDPETPDGHVLLSARQVAKNQFWSRLETLKKDDMPIQVKGVNVNDRGVVVELDSISAFIPVSQLGKEVSKDPEKLVGSIFSVKILEVDSKKQRLVLSERAVTEADEIKRAQVALKSVKEGDVFKGKVTTITSFGIFVEVKVKKELIEGLVHVSELSWAKIVDPKEIAKVGDTVTVQALHTDSGKLALSIKQAKNDPWEEAAKKYKAESKHKGKIIKVSNFGVFVELEQGIEGLIHMTKIPPGTSLNRGQELNCYVEEIDMDKHKISLGLILTTSKPIGYK